MGELPYGFADDPEDTTQRRFGDHLDEAADLDVTTLGGGPTTSSTSWSSRRSAASATSRFARLVARRRVVRAARRSRACETRASCIAWSLRNLFNKPEVMGIVRGSEREGAYWHDVLLHCVHGGLQSVLDEYVHVLDQRAASAEPDDTRMGRSRDEFDEATSLRTAMQTFTDIRCDRAGSRSTPHRTRTHLAVRFGRGVAEDDKSVDA